MNGREVHDVECKGNDGENGDLGMKLMKLNEERTCKSKGERHKSL